MSGSKASFCALAIAQSRRFMQMIYSGALDGKVQREGFCNRHLPCHLVLQVKDVDIMELP